MQEKRKVKPSGWVALVIMIVMFSGLTSGLEGPLQFLNIFDLNTLTGSFGTIGETGANFAGSGGAGARDGFLFALTLAPAATFAMGLIEVFGRMGIMDAMIAVFTPILRPLLGLPGSCGLAFVNSLNGSDVAAMLTRDLYNDGLITDDERSIFAVYQYAGSAPIGNIITTQAALLPCCVLATGPLILVIIVCKLVGANLFRLFLFMRRGGKKAAKA